MNRTTRILLVDDNRAILETFSIVLRSAGYEVEQACTGEESLAKAREKRPEIVLLDVVLPDISGIEVCRQMKAEPTLSDTFIVLISGAATSSAEKVEGLDTGADDYLTKPVEMNEFLARVRTIARLQEARSALRLSEQHYRRLIEILPDAVVIMDVEGRLSAVNEQAVEMLGYGTAEELLVKSVFDLTPAHHHEPIRADIAATLHTGSLRSAEYALLAKSGAAFPVELSSAALNAGNGRPPRIVLVARDITERKRAQVELEKLALVVQNSSELVYLADLDGRMIFINRAGSRMVGILPEDVGQHRINDIVAEAFQETAKAEVTPLTLKQGKWEGDLQYRNLKTGRLIDVHAMVFLVREPATGKPLYLANISLDISERRRAEEQIRLLADALQSSQELVSITSSDNYFTFFNRAFLKAYGYSQEEILGRKPDFLFSLSNPPGLAEQIYRQTRRGGWRGELLNCRKDGSEFPISLSTSQIKSSDGKTLGLLSVARDISERKLAERQRSAFAQLGYRLSGAIKPEQVAQTIVEIASELIGWDACYVHLYSSSTDQITPILTMDTLQGERMKVETGRSSTEPSPVMRWVMKEGAQLIRRNDSAELPVTLVPFGDTSRRSAAMMYAPIRSGGATVGILSIQSYTPQAYSLEDVKLLQSLADYCGEALQRITVAEALLEAEAKYRQIVENAAEGIFQTTPEGHYRSANPAMARILGYQSPEQLISNVTDVAQQVYVNADRREELKRLLATQDSVRGFEVEHYRQDGSKVWVNQNVHAVRDRSGTLQYFEGTCLDITERKQAQQRLADALELNQTILATSSVGILAYRASGQCVFANQAAARIAHTTLEELLRENFPNIEAWQKCGLLELARFTLHSRKVQAAEVRTVTAVGGEIWLNCHMASFESGGEQHLLVLSSDITTRKQAEDLLQVQRDFGVFLSSTNDLKSAARQLVDIAMQTEGIDCAAVFLVEGENGVFHLAAHRGWPSHFRKNLEHLAQESIQTGFVAVSRGIQVTRGGALSSSCQEEERKRNLAIETIPLRHSGRVIALLSVGSMAKEQVPGRSRLRIETVASQAGDALARIQAEEELRDLPRRITQAQEAERQRVARELHDGVNQIIAAAKLRLRKVQERLITINPVAREMLARCADLMVQALEENRRIAQGLRPSDLDELGLAEACHNLCQQVRLRTHLDLKCTIARLTQRLPAAVELNLFRILQEALNNVEKHAQARKVQVRLEAQAHAIVLRILDDGRGFVPTATKSGRKQGSGIGLTNMHDRAASLGGTCEIRAAAGGGTEVTIRVPYKSGTPANE